ncbi:unnamed protein product [Colias eurytheme]|nr:unnamed protein product [Colias eurytheme]
MATGRHWVNVFALLATITIVASVQVEDPCKLKSRVTADDKYCDKYWECENGQAVQSNYCEYPKVQINPPLGTEHCDWLYGIFGHETSCTRYWTCWNGTATEQLCIGGLLYNENAHSCDWPENVDGCQKHPLCNEDPNGNVPLGKSCNRYWQCQGGYPRLQRCPAMLVFDRRSLRCVVPPTEECDIPTTTGPPPEEEEQRQAQRQEQNPHKSNRPSKEYNLDGQRPRPRN